MGCRTSRKIQIDRAHVLVTNSVAALCEQARAIAERWTNVTVASSSTAVAVLGNAIFFTELENRFEGAARTVYVLTVQQQNND